MKMHRLNYTQSAWQASELKSLQQQFLNTAESLQAFFATLENWDTVQTKEFSSYYEATSKAEQTVLMAQHKLALVS